MTEKRACRVPLSEALQVISVTSHTYKANLLDDYCYGPGKSKSTPVPSPESCFPALLLINSFVAAVHGGYLASVVLRTVTEHFQTTLKHFNQPNTLTLHLEYLRSATAGSADLLVKDVKKGSQTSTVHISLSQGGKEKVAGYAT